MEMKDEQAWVNQLFYAVESGADDVTIAAYVRCSWDEVQEYFDRNPDIQVEFYHKRAGTIIAALNCARELCAKNASAFNYFLKTVGYGEAPEDAWADDELDRDLADNIA